MMSLADVSGVIQSLTVVKDLVQANQSFRNFNELASAVADVNTKLMHFLSAAVEAKEKELAFVNRISELEKENMELKNWDRERERYQLTKTTADTLVYCLKPGMEQGEPAHLLCANCFDDNKKSILQPKLPQGALSVCPRCPKEIYTRSLEAPASVRMYDARDRGAY